MARASRSLLNQKCVITGAASGIGRATALLAAKKGALLFLTDLQLAPLQQVADEIRAAGGTVLLLEALDISDHAAVTRFAQRIHEQHGSVDVVMNIAGTSIWGAVESLAHDHWRKLIEVNLMGPIHIIESFVPAMVRARRGGHLVNVSSAAGLLGLPWHAAYSASKFGLRGISEVLRFDLARHGIDVSLVCPGAVDTPLVGTLELIGVDRDLPAVRALQARFQRHAITPEQAAVKIVRGIERRTYMVFTSPDIRLAFWLSRTFAWPYELLMRRLNDQVHAVAVASGYGVDSSRGAEKKQLTSEASA